MLRTTDFERHKVYGTPLQQPAVRGQWLACVACKGRQKKYEIPRSTPLATAQRIASVSDFRTLLPSGFPGNIPNPTDPFEVRILGPYSRLVKTGGSKNDAIRHRHFLPETDSCRQNGNGCGEIDNRTLQHQGHRLQGVGPLRWRSTVLKTS